MRVLLTGGAGFIGSCLVWKLNQQGLNNIIVVDRLGSSEKWKNLVGKEFQDYLDKDKLWEVLETNKLKGALDFVVHLGACTSTSEQDASYLMENNYLYSRRLAQWALKNKVYFLYASSAATYGEGELGYSDSDKTTLKLRPLNMYGYSKHLFDLWVLKNKLTTKVTGFKFFNVFGPNEYHKAEMQSVIAKNFAKIVAGEPFRLFESYKKEYADGEQKRDFIYVKDALEVLFYFIAHPQKTGIFNLGTGKAESWNNLALALFSALGMSPKIEYIEMPPQLRQKYQYFTQADICKLRKAGCKHKFLTLQEAIKDYVIYLKNHAYL